MERLAEWEKRFGYFLLDHAAHPRGFEWGKFDCALFAADCIIAITGVDIASELRGHYKSYNSARRIMRRTAGYGLESLADKLTAEHRAYSVDIKMARRGDMLLFDTLLGPTLGVVSLDGITAFVPARLGVEPRRALDARRAWRI
jgi:hypothetical protein